MNSVLIFFYRDADNYKAYNEWTINGELTEEQEKQIIECLLDKEMFIPEQVGIEAYRFDEFLPECDHVWCEFYGFSKTKLSPNDTPNDMRTPEEFVAAFEACKENWDELYWYEKVSYRYMKEQELEVDK